MHFVDKRYFFIYHLLQVYYCTLCLSHAEGYGNVMIAFIEKKMKPSIQNWPQKLEKFVESQFVIRQFIVLTTDGAGVAAVSISDEEHQNKPIRGRFPDGIFVIALCLIFFSSVVTLKPIVYCGFMELEDFSQDSCQGVIQY